MKEKKNIDRIFQEKFKDFEKEPRDKIWDNIASKLDENERKRPFIIPLWMKLGGVAAVLAVVLASLLFTKNQETTPQEPGMVYEIPEETRENEVEKNQSNEENSEAQLVSEETDKSNPAGEKSSAREDYSSSSNDNSASDSAMANRNTGNEENSISKKSTTKKREHPVIASEETESPATINEKEKVAIKPGLINNQTSGSIAQAEETRKDSAATENILKQEKNALAQLEEQNKNAEKEEETAGVNSGKLRLSTFAAPLFYKNMGSGNELSAQFSNNPSSSEVTFTYGIKVAYELSEKIRIRTGVSKVDINYNISDISYSPAAMAGSFENIRPAAENVQIRSDAAGPSNSFASESTNRNSLAASIFTPGEINQQFGFIEVPLELEYSLIDKKFGLNIIGGGSSLFLDSNRVDLVSGNSNTNLGEAANINKTSFSTNIGLGMDYKLNDRFSISLEPIFKYQINTFNNVENVQPVNFGIYSGLNFRF